MNNTTVDHSDPWFDRDRWEQNRDSSFNPLAHSLANQVELPLDPNALVDPNALDDPLSIDTQQNNGRKIQGYALGDIGSTMIAHHLDPTVSTVEMEHLTGKPTNGVATSTQVSVTFDQLVATQLHERDFIAVFDKIPDDFAEMTELTAQIQATNKKLSKASEDIVLDAHEQEKINQKKLAEHLADLAAERQRGVFWNFIVELSSTLGLLVSIGGMAATGSGWAIGTGVAAIGMCIEGRLDNPAKKALATYWATTYDKYGRKPIVDEEKKRASMRHLELGMAAIMLVSAGYTAKTTGLRLLPEGHPSLPNFMQGLGMVQSTLSLVGNSGKFVNMQRYQYQQIALTELKTDSDGNNDNTHRSLYTIENCFGYYWSAQSKARHAMRAQNQTTKQVIRGGK